MVGTDPNLLSNSLFVLRCVPRHCQYGIELSQQTRRFLSDFRQIEKYFARDLMTAKIQKNNNIYLW